MHAALALHWLDHDADGVLGTCRLECPKIVERRIGEAFGHRPEADLACIVRLAGCGHGTEGAPVEGFTGGDDMVLFRAVLFHTIFTGHLDHGFIGLGTGILIEDLVHADGRADLLGEQRLRNGVWVVEGLHQHGGLILHRLDDLLVAVADRIDRDACVEIKIRGVVLVVHVDAFGMVRQKIETLIGLDHVLVDLALDVFERQSGILQLHDAVLLAMLWRRP